MNRPTKPTPVLQISLALVLVAVSLGIGIWLLLNDDSPPKTVTQSVVPVVPTTADASVPPVNGIQPPKFWEDPAGKNWDKSFFNLKSPDALRKTSENSWSIKGGRLFMQVHRDQAGKLVVRFVYPFEEMLPKDTVAMLRSRWTPWETHKLIDELKISTEQWEKFMAIDPNTDVKISAADRRAAVALFNEAIKAFNTNETVNGGLPTVPEEKLTDFVRDLDQKHHQATFDSVNAIANQIKTLFTEAQYAGLMRRFGTW